MPSSIHLQATQKLKKKNGELSKSEYKTGLIVIAFHLVFPMF
jgi:hypothetical protein